MERSVAIKKLSGLLGKTMGYRVNPNAPTREERETAKVALKAAAEERQRLETAKRERFNALIAADAEYQSLKTAFEAAREKANRLMSAAHSYKITVGITNSMFFHVMAEGDSWEEIIDKVQADKRKAA